MGTSCSSRGNPIKSRRAGHFTFVSPSNRPRCIERLNAPAHVRRQPGRRPENQERVMTWVARKFPRSLSVLIVSILGGVLFGGCAGDEPVAELRQEEHVGAQANQVIADWIVHTQNASGANTPPRRSRTFAMVSVAMHDAVNGIKSRYARYASSARDREAS